MTESMIDVVNAIRSTLEAAPPHSRWVQLATVDPAGIARLRTVVLHEITADARLVIATDATSEKVRALRADPRAEVLLLSRERLEQWRLLARWDVIDDAADPERLALWRRMEPREKGYYVSPPAGLDRAAYPDSAFHAECRDPDPPSRFVLLRGEVLVADRLVVAVTPHRRHVHRRDDGFRAREVTP